VQKKIQRLTIKSALNSPNSCNPQHSQQGGSSPRETLLPHGDYFSCLSFSSPSSIKQK
jgi:hypothetical protein